MKKGLILLTSILLLSSGYGVAQMNKEQQKARKELSKQTKKELNEKATKAARKEAKQLTKEGWKVAPGALPLEKQLDRAYLMQYEYDNEGYPKYIMGNGMSSAGNYDAGKMQALELAKLDLVNQIESDMTSLTESSLANSQMEQSEAATVTKTISAAKSIISQKLGRVIPVVESYRVVNGNNREVRVLIAYNMETAKKITKEAIREELEKQGDQLHNKLDQLLGW